MATYDEWRRAQEQARRDFAESQRQHKDREERMRAEREAREMEMRKLQEIQKRQREEEARLRAQRAQQRHRW